MTASNSISPKRVSMPQTILPAEKDFDTQELIDRLATELRAKSDPDLPHTFYVEQVRRQLAGKPVETSAANAGPAPAEQDGSSVFRSWAMPE